MNHIYRLVWNQQRNGWVAVSEITRGKKKSSVRSLVAAALSLSAVVAHASPSGGQVIAGTGQVRNSGNTTTITQSSQNLSLNWQSFNITPQETVNFVQPSASAVAVNRILGTDGTQILGHLNANGQVYLINPNGILFGAGAQVNVGALVASTLDMDSGNTGNSSRSFSGKSTGSVTNEGTITAATGGYVALLGNRVNNSGTIVAQLGSVGLGAGSAVTLTFSGDSLVSMQVDRSTLNNLAANGGVIQADGGRVIMTAGAHEELLASVVNNTGVIEARTVEDHEGTITLLGGMSAGQVNVGGTVDASAPDGGNGGAIETSASHVSVANDARVTTAASHGLTGSWLIDPQDFTVAASGGDISGTALSTQLSSNNIQLQSSSGAASHAGDVNINDSVAWSANTSLTLTASNNVNVNANITATGATAGLAVNPNTANGSEAPSGVGAYVLNNGSSITLSGSHPTLSIAGHGYTVINSLGGQGSMTGTDLQGISANLSGYYALGSNIDASATSSWNNGAGFLPLGSSPAFTGTFNGQGHSVANLTISRPTLHNVGLFGHVSSSGVVQNVALTGGTITGGNSTGALAGENEGTISNSSESAPVRGAYWVGGLVGLNYGAITNSYATGAVNNSSYATGGLVGQNGTYSKHGSAAVSNSYATGAVSATAAAVGGLAGISYGTIANSYAMGSATVSGSNQAETGGLVGALGGGSIVNSYATGLVTAQRQVGGLVGVQIAGSVTNSYWNTTTSGQATSAGGTGLTATQMQTASNFSGFAFTTTPGAAGNNWVMVDTNGTVNNASGTTGAALPMLASEYATTITNTHQLQLMEMALGANYSLGGDINAAATAGNNDVWTSSAGFVPIATVNATTYTGIFNGLDHSINGLVINRPSANSVGMFTSSSGTIENLGLVGGTVNGGGYWTGGLVGRNGGAVTNSHVTGRVVAGTYVGGLAGTNSGTISDSYSTATVVGYGHGNVGGLVGANYGAIAGSYETGTVSAGGSRVGGLVGANFSATITNSYASGGVSGGSSVGGLVGSNYGPVSKSYATGAVTGSSTLGGLVGNNHVVNSVSNSVWDTTTTGVATSSGGGTGLTTAQMRQQSNFTGWDFAGTWITYSGNTDPLLRSFMTPLTVTATSASQTYNGLALSGGSGATYSVTPNANLLGSLTFGGAGANAGNYTITPAGLYSNQQGYIINYASGTLTVNPATLIVVGSSADNKVYDATTFARVTGGTLSGVIGSDSVTLTQGGVFASANVGTGIAITASDSLGGAAAGNYTLMQPNGVSANITPATLIVVGSSADNKVYDATTFARVTGGTLSGVIGSDSVTLTRGGVFASANVGTGIAITASDSLGGAAAGNYTLMQPNGVSANITPATLTVTGTGVGNKVYDGTTFAALTGGTLSGVIGSDAITLTQAGTFDSANVGAGIAVTASDSLGGAGSANYRLSQPVALNANINPATLTYTASSYGVTAGKPAPALSGTVSGFVSGDSLGTATSGTPAWATNETASSPPGSYAIDGGGLVAGNYVFRQAAANATAFTVGAAPITPSSVSGLESSVLIPTHNNDIQTFGSSPTTLPPSMPVSGVSSGSDILASSSGGGFASGKTTVIDPGIDLGSKGTLSIEDHGVNIPDDVASIN
jgi:filamentous hemagglutinin family protein